MFMDEQNPDEYIIPLQDQRVFGAGIRRKRVQFVPSSSHLTKSTQTSVTKSGATGDFYLSLVLPKSNEGKERSPAESNTLCEVCNIPLGPENSDNKATGKPTVPDVPHESLLAHQVCLSHSHPPSHLDRSRKGLQYLESYGWDPDSRKGLGREGQGIR